MNERGPVVLAPRWLFADGTKELARVRKRLPQPIAQDHELVRSDDVARVAIGEKRMEVQQHRFADLLPLHLADELRRRQARAANDLRTGALSTQIARKPYISR